MQNRQSIWLFSHFNRANPTRQSPRRNQMKCRSCGSKNTRVTVTEHRGHTTWRYCRCLDCAHKFKTVEVYDKKIPKRPGPKPGIKQPWNTGELNGLSKLWEKDVKLLRHLASTGRSQRELAKIFGISQSTVSKIVRRQVWIHVI